VVGGDKDGEPLYMAPWILSGLYSRDKGKKRKSDDNSNKKYHEFQGWYTRTVEFLDERKLRIRAGSPMKQPFEIPTTRLTH
jgi:hypothetical protein